MKETTCRRWAVASGVAALLMAVPGCRGGLPFLKGKAAAPVPSSTSAGEEPSKGASAKGAAEVKAAGAVAPAAGSEGKAAPALGRESPFPGKPGGRGSKTHARVTALHRGDIIPGMPRVSIPPPKRTPFRLQGEGLGSAHPTKRVPASANPPEAGRATSKRPGGIPPMPGLGGIWDLMGGNPIPGGPGSGSVTIRPAPATLSAPQGERTAAAPTPATPALHLTGVIEGNPPMAIVESGTGHYVVRTGDRVPGGYVVSGISLQQVILRATDRRTLVLRLGGSRG